MLRLKPGSVEWRTLEGRVVAVHLATHEVMETNRTGALLWSALRDGTTRPGLIAVITREFGVDDAAAARDVDAFLSDLAAVDVIEETGDSDV